MRPPQNPEQNYNAILNSPSYVLPEQDLDLLARPSLRPIRLQLELLKPELALADRGIQSTIVVFGGTQVVETEEAERRLARARAWLEDSPENPLAKRALQRAENVAKKSHYYEEARQFARLVSSSTQTNNKSEYVVITGGGPGAMEAANRGAYDVNAMSIGLNITLPEEQRPNSYITPDLCFQFHYFAIRKMHFLMRAKALVVFPGGFGTLDELFEALTLVQTRKMERIPIIMYGRKYWEQVINFQFLADEGVIADDHLKLFDFAESPQECWDLIARFYGDPRAPTART